MKFGNILLALVSSCATLVCALDFSNSSWIWTRELPSPGGFVPVGARAFRRLIPSPQGVVPVLANVLITVDNAYTLFVNGNQVGTGGDFLAAQDYCVSLFSPCGTLIAVNAVNEGSTPNPAGVLATIQITYSDGSTQTVVSDARWKALDNPNIPSDFNLFSFDDSAWPNAVTEGVIGSSPWGQITLPNSTSCGCSS